MVNPGKLALTLGIFVGGMHVLWSILVLLGWAQALVDFKLWAHMIHVNVTIGPFDGTAAITVIVVSSIVGYAVGYVAGTIWNKVHA